MWINISNNQFTEVSSPEEDTEVPVTTFEIADASVLGDITFEQVVDNFGHTMLQSNVTPETYTALESGSTVGEVMTNG